MQRLYLWKCNITAGKLTALSPALPFIKVVDLSVNKQIGMQGYAELAKTIVEASRQAEQKGKCIDLQRLSLQWCSITAEELAALSPALTFIKDVNLSYNLDMGTLGYVELAKTIVKASGEAEQRGKCIDLQTLSLQWCDITAEELAALSPALPFIKEVDLSDNMHMGTQGHAELAKNIVKASREAEQKGKCIDLQTLSLQWCNITAEELAALSPALPFIKEVHLSYSKQIGIQGYAELAKAIVKGSEDAEQKGKCVDLQELYLWNCDTSAEELAALLLALTFMKLAHLSYNLSYNLSCNLSYIGTLGYPKQGKTIVKACGEVEQKGMFIDFHSIYGYGWNINAKKLSSLLPALLFIKKLIYERIMKWENKGMLNWQKLFLRPEERRNKRESALTYRDYIF